VQIQANSYDAAGKSKERAPEQDLVCLGKSPDELTSQNTLKNVIRRERGRGAEIGLGRLESADCGAAGNGVNPWDQTGQP